MWKYRIAGLIIGITVGFGFWVWYESDSASAISEPLLTAEEKFAVYIEWLPPGSTNMREIGSDHCWILFDLPVEGKVHTFMYRHAWDIPIITKIDTRDQTEKGE